MKSSNLLLYFTSRLVQALTVQQFFIVPNGDEPDFSITYYGGQIIPLQWKALNDTYDDLWVTSFDQEIHHYHEIIARGIDLSVDGSYNWEITIPSAVLAADAKYVLRFKRYAHPRTAYSASTLELSSPGILILNPPPSQSSSTPSSTPTGPAKPSHKDNGPSTSDGLSTAAKAGIGVGVGVGVLVILGVLLYLFSRHRKVRSEKANNPPPAYTSEIRRTGASGKDDMANRSTSPAELRGSWSPPELE